MPRRLSRQRVREYIIAGLLALLILWLAWLLFGIFRKEEIARRAVTDTRADLATLQAREVALKENIAELNTPRGEEATLRDTYGVAKPGEGVIIVVPSQVATSSPPLPWWRKFMGLFGL